ncbi:MAG: ATP-binding protein [Sphaerochaeta sp.]
MVIPRESYIKELEERRFNGQVKVITGLRRVGKSFLLFTLYCAHLERSGVPKDQIITINLEDEAYSSLRNATELSTYIRSKITDSKKEYYVLLDEIQYAIAREEMKDPRSSLQLYGVLNGLLTLGNVDVYVTGSNAKFLSKDVMTEFRGRGDVLHIHPLSFKEVYEYNGGDIATQYEMYALYGGLPQAVLRSTDEQKIRYLTTLFDEVYFKDIIERYDIRFGDVLGQITNLLCSSIGSRTNAHTIANTLKSVQKRTIASETVASYIAQLLDSFLFLEAKRYDVKGRLYFSYPNKYYATDVGLRNARLAFRQQEEGHIMETVVYNELIRRTFSVDVGVVTIREKDKNDVLRQRQLEIDFVANKGSLRYYIQVATSLDQPDVRKRELRPFFQVKDSFKKIMITKTLAPPNYDEDGILHMGLYHFLLNEDALSH